MYYLGIDLGGTNIAVGVVDENCRIIKKDSVPTYKDRPYQEIVKDMADLSFKVVKETGLKISDIKSAGIGSPGIPDGEKGILIYACTFKFENAPFREELQKYIDIPVFLENDANCAALAESIAGAAKDVCHSIAITLGTGIGGGVIIDNKIYSGFNYAASELGHMVIKCEGEPCSCGRKGCFEAYASATALIRQTKKAAEENPQSIINKLVNGDLSKIDAKTAFDASRQEDETGRKVVHQYIKYLSEGLTNIINIFEPGVVVIGGGISKEGEYLLKPLREQVARGVYTKQSGVRQTEIRVARMGNDAGIIGAAMLGK
jgi:glucokinase